MKLMRVSWDPTRSAYRFWHHGNTYRIWSERGWDTTLELSGDTWRPRPRSDKKD